MSHVIVHALRPGDVVDSGLGERALHVTQTAHPLWPDLQLVVWRLLDGRWSHDALDPRQVVGTVTPTTDDVRRERLRAALVGVDGDWTQVPA